MSVNLTICNKKEFQTFLITKPMSPVKKERLIEYFSKSNAEIPYNALVIFKHLDKTLQEIRSKKTNIESWRIIAVGDTVADLVMNARNKNYQAKLENLKNNLKEVLTCENIESELKKYAIENELEK